MNYVWSHHWRLSFLRLPKDLIAVAAVSKGMILKIALFQISEVL